MVLGTSAVQRRANGQLLGRAGKRDAAVGGVCVEALFGRLGENAIEGFSFRPRICLAMGNLSAEPEVVGVGSHRPHGPRHRSHSLPPAARASTVASGGGWRELMAE
jgi:hypothetical protein